MNTRLVLGGWDSLKDDAQPVRYQVFVLEQQVPLELEWDEMDAPSLHAVAYDAQDRPVATGRLLPDGHIGRMAVLQPWRGQGVGGEVLRALIDAAARRGDAAVVLNAQVHAAEFYVRHGFVRFGAEFMEAGIPHIAMRRLLAAAT